MNYATTRASTLLRDPAWSSRSKTRAPVKGRSSPTYMSQSVVLQEAASAVGLVSALRAACSSPPKQELLTLNHAHTALFGRYEVRQRTDARSRPAQCMR